MIKCLRKYNLYYPIKCNINIDLTLKNLQLNNFKEIYADAFKRRDMKNIVVLLTNNIPYDINEFKIAVKNKIIKIEDTMSSCQKTKIFDILSKIIQNE
jgi:hypothetical protein